MKIGIIGAGRIGGNAARLFTRAGHEVLVSFSRDPDTLHALATELGGRAQVGTPAEAATFGPVVMVSVPWPAVDVALGKAGSLEGKIVIDTTNQFTPGSLDNLGTQTAAEVNQAVVIVFELDSVEAANRYTDDLPLSAGAAALHVPGTQAIEEILEQGEGRHPGRVAHRVLRAVREHACP